VPAKILLKHYVYGQISCLTCRNFKFASQPQTPTPQKSTITEKLHSDKDCAAAKNLRAKNFQGKSKPPPIKCLKNHFKPQKTRVCTQFRKWINL